MVEKAHEEELRDAKDHLLQCQQGQEPGGECQVREAALAGPFWCLCPLAPGGCWLVEGWFQARGVWLGAMASLGPQCGRLAESNKSS